MDFKSKLALLARPAPSQPSSPEGNDKASTLLELRQKMAEILAASGPAPSSSLPAEPPPLGVILPFRREERKSGPLFRRHQLLPPSHHVGRMPVDAAASSRAELLGLLALDPRISSVDPRRALYFDTETTGLGGGAGVLAFLVGIAWFDAELRLHAEQFLLRSPAEEAPLLEAFAERLEACDLLVSYNGKAFDLPLLNGRMVMNRRPKLPDRAHLDLLHIARRLHKGRLGPCRLIGLEADVLGFQRGPDIAGIDIAPRYAHFLRSGDESALEDVVEHNAWDVVSMAALVGLYGEPFELLHEQDLLGLARTLKRARAFDEAERAASVALERGVGPEARRAHGEIAKARGDRAQALAHFEAFAAEVHDPAIRLELAKLYEHHVKAPLSALSWADDTSEDPEKAQRRRARLAQKIAKSAKKSGK
ncbi:MAG TPA: ribonuclease H-like domain-containing protein [Polyangiaceae bacterium]|nr:ribonuclease H-like domain-containing protein [Polyangiaceae bacterium]